MEIAASKWGKVVPTFQRLAFLFTGVPLQC
jgi:hypothetical protein